MKNIWTLNWSKKLIYFVHISFESSYDTYAALNISAPWSITDWPIKLGANINRKWATTIPMHIVISEISIDTVNALTNCNNVLNYHSYISIYIRYGYNYKNWIKCKTQKMYYMYISKVLTRKRLQLKDITLIITIAKCHLLIIFIKNVENLQ